MKKEEITFVLVRGLRFRLISHFYWQDFRETSPRRALAAILEERTIAKMSFWGFDSIIMLNLGDILVPHGRLITCNPRIALSSLL